MIKCPNCGSTAQIKQNLVSETFGAGGQSIHHYKNVCGCGQVFTSFRYTSDTDDAETIYFQRKEILIKYEKT